MLMPDWFKKSMAVQMMLVVLGSTAVVLAAVEIFTYIHTRSIILDTGERVAIALTRSTTRRIEQEFRAVEKIAQNLSLSLDIAPITKASQLNALLAQSVQDNSELFGAGLFFEPHGFLRDKEAFAPYVFRKDGRIRHSQLGRPDYDYRTLGFYLTPRIFNETAWSEPYYDKGGGSTLMVTYSVPLYLKGRRHDPAAFNGVVTADLSLEWLNSLVSSIHMGKKGYSFIITDTGRFVVHPDTSLLLNESMFTMAEKRNLPRLRAFARQMIRTEQGFTPTQMELAGEPAYLAWDKIPATGWSLGSVVVKSELFSPLGQMLTYHIFMLISGVMLLALVSVFISRSLSRPLIVMARTTRKIAKGNLEVDLSEIQRKDEVGQLALSIETMAEGLRQKEFIRATFGRYLTNEVVDRLLESRDGLKLGGQARQITLLMSDLRGFTALGAKMEPEALISLLNSYLGEMVDIIVHHKGVIDEIIGDGILAFFGAPEPMEAHTRQAVACALDMQQAMDKINALNREKGLAPLEMGIAVHTGTVVVGNIGSETRSKYGAVGAEVNFTGRMESYCVGGQILVSQAVYDQLGNALGIRETFEVEMKGLAEPAVLYDIQGLENGPCLPDLQMHQNRLVSPIEVSVQRLDKKHIDGHEIPGRITHGSTRSVTLEFGAPVTRWEDIRVVLPGESGVFYAKVVQLLSGDTGCRALARITSPAPGMDQMFKQVP